MANIQIYTKGYCPYCNYAKAFFQRKQWTFEEINVENDPLTFEEMLAKSNGRKTVPQIFINGSHIGGYDDMMALETSGKLEGLYITS